MSLFFALSLVFHSAMLLSSRVHTTSHRSKRVKGLIQSISYQQFLPPIAGPQKAVGIYNASTPDPCVDAFFAAVALPAFILSASTV